MEKREVPVPSRWRDVPRHVREQAARLLRMCRHSGEGVTAVEHGKHMLEYHIVIKREEYVDSRREYWDVTVEVYHPRQLLTAVSAPPE